MIVRSDKQSLRKLPLYNYTKIQQQDRQGSWDCCLSAIIRIESGYLCIGRGFRPSSTGGVTSFLPSLAMTRWSAVKVTKFRFVSLLGLLLEIRKDCRLEGFEATFTAWNVTDLSGSCQVLIWGLGRFIGGYILEECGTPRPAWGSALKRQSQPRV